MAVSKVIIANMALAHLGNANVIESFSERSPQAKAASFWYDEARRQTLQGFDWTFARKRLALAIHSEAPPAEWLFRYQWPTDCLQARSIFNPFGFVGRPYPWCDVYSANMFAGATDAVTYEIQADSDGISMTILTNQDAAELIYTRDIIQESLFPALFTRALSHNLASLMAMQMTQKTAIQQREEQRYQGILRAAAADDANQERPQAPRDASWMRGR